MIRIVMNLFINKLNQSLSPLKRQVPLSIRERRVGLGTNESLARVQGAVSYPVPLAVPCVPV